MKLIRICALVAAMAVVATAQSTSTNSQSTGSTSQTSTADNQKSKSKPTPASSKSTPGKGAQSGGNANQNPGVQLKVIKKPGQSTRTGTKNSASTNSATAKNSTTAKSTTTTSGTASKTGSQQGTGKNTGATGNSSSTTSASKNAVKAGPAPKAPAVAVKPAQPVAKTTSSTKTAKKTVAKPPVTAKKKEDKVKVLSQKSGSTNKAAGAVETIRTGPAGRRDPFVSIIRNAPMTSSGPNCSVGKRCLYIPELTVKGIAKDTEGQMLAVVVSNTQRAYFLRENDQVFNGSVEKITADSVVFREFSTDTLGRETAHEIVKRIPKS